MKILIVMSGFFPGKKYGGPPVSVDNFCSLMKTEDCYIITHNHDKDESEPYENINNMEWLKRDNCSVLYLSDEEYNKKNFEKIMNQINPDIIYLQGLFQSCIVPCLQLAKKYKKAVLLAPRGELCAGAFRKKYKKIPYILGLRLTGMLENVVYQSTSIEETEAIQKYLKCDSNKIMFLTNVPSIPKRKYKRNIKQKDAGKFIFLSRIHPKKNLIGAIRLFSHIKGKVVFDIYGPIEDENYWKDCQEEIKRIPKNVNINYCGLVTHEDVHAVFSKYDAFLFPTYSENYGHVIAEALSVGTPVIVSDQTPWLELKSKGVGWDIPLKNEIEFVNAIQAIVDMNTTELEDMNQRAIVFFEQRAEVEKLYKQYIAVLNCTSNGGK